MLCHVDQVGQNAWYIDCRDSFITKQDKYRWAEPFLLYRDDSRPTYNTTASYKLYETVPDYFSGAVLQRHHLNDTNPGVVTLKFQVAFNLAVVWMIVFVSLSKGKLSFLKRKEIVHKNFCSCSFFNITSIFTRKRRIEESNCWKMFKYIYINEHFYFHV